MAVELGEAIRAMGWPARAYGNPNSTDVLLIPLAIRAGLGELGKHGSMIGLEHGSNFRLAAVLTDLPMALDAPVDIGVQDVCTVCRRCVDDCPPRAILEEKQLVRGERKWYVDFDKCIPYFVKTCGCAICIEVCPWSEPGRGPALSERVLAVRRERLAAAGCGSWRDAADAGLMASHGEKVVLQVAGREVAVSNPRKLYFPEAGVTKLEVVQYYVAVAEGALRGAGGRPNVLVRYANGIHGEFFYQKRAPEKRPDWIEVASLSFPSGRRADEVVPRDAAALAWMANLGCLELHPHPVRTQDLDHPDELRVDLDPMPGVEWSQIQAVARVVRDVLGDSGLVGWPKTSGSRGVHVNVRIHPRWGFSELRRAALALAREVERRAPEIATSKWWKEERHGVFIDYNQNAKDRTVASAYSVRPKPDARVSAPVTWDELFDCRPEEFTLRTMPARFAAIGDRHARIDESPGSLEALLELSARQEAEGQGDAPWPPHYAKQAGEPPRVQPSKRRPTARRPAAASPRSRSSRSPARARSRTRSPGSSAGRPATRRRRRISRPPTCWWTRCAAAPRPGPAFA